MIEADGVDQFQGYMNDREREQAFEAAMDAGSWAGETLRKRNLTPLRRPT